MELPRGRRARAGVAGARWSCLGFAGARGDAGDEGEGWPSGAVVEGGPAPASHAGGRARQLGLYRNTARDSVSANEGNERKITLRFSGASAYFTTCFGGLPQVPKPIVFRFHS
jgi:hypothetical protein